MSLICLSKIRLFVPAFYPALGRNNSLEVVVHPGIHFFLKLAIKYYLDAFNAMPKRQKHLPFVPFVSG